jgi:hypothetical protein
MLREEVWWGEKGRVGEDAVFGSQPSRRERRAQRRECGAGCVRDWGGLLRRESVFAQGWGRRSGLAPAANNNNSSIY